MSDLKVRICQINNSVGDFNGNYQKIIEEVKKSEEENCDLAIFCEMTLSGYPCEDLWQKEYFIKEAETKIKLLCQETKDYNCAILLGAPTLSKKSVKNSAKNSAILIEKGKVIKVIDKNSLPNYGVFDEERYFAAQKHLSLVEFRGQTLAILICEDLWNNKNLFLLKEQVFDNIIALNSSPYTKNKLEKRLKTVRNFSKSSQKSLIYVNQFGAQDSLVFDGSSFVVDNQGDLEFLMKSFEKDQAILTLSKSGKIKSNYTSQKENKTNEEKDYLACIIGIHDYINKNGFKKVLLGMSGGIDSALVATMAVDALGSENVALFALPTRYNSEESMNDAVKCAHNLETTLKVISIEESFNSMLNTIGETKNSLTQENLQSRIRGNILMALSNDTGALLLSTGNKSEMAMGYATIYGDMCGAFNPIKDLYKTEVFKVARWRNKNIPSISFHQKNQIIPENIINKPPSAELRENQKDSDSLPEYDILDNILFQIIEEEKSVEEIIKSGHDKELVTKISRSFYFSEYKRRQAVIGPKLSTMSFDKDRRYPITNKFIK